MNRLDVQAALLGIAESRTVARRLIEGGQILLNGTPATKPSQQVSDNDRIELIGELPRYAGRGGYKLEGAVEAFGLVLDGLICLDVGASTGGFTDCMLQNGARAVYAVDVGRGQLHEKLRRDERITSLEETDIRSLDAARLPEMDFAAVDVSFISLKLVLPELTRFLKRGCGAVVLVKPQFEVGRRRLKNGVLRDEGLRAAVVAEMRGFAGELGFSVRGECEAKITGGDGNREVLLYLFHEKRGRGCEGGSLL